MGFLDSEQRFHDEASAAADYGDFGDPAYRDGLRVLLQSYDEEARFHDQGAMMAEYGIVETLRRRLLSQRFLDNRTPTENVRRPLVILGLVRTGSTALHYLIGQDPSLQALQYWLACYPQPRPGDGDWPTNEGFQQAKAELDATYAADPSLRAIHNMEPDLPEECRHLLAQSFTDDGMEANATVPSYSSWYENCDMQPSYKRHRQLVELIGSAVPEQRWLLKYPAHMRHLAAFLEAYPDACIIQTHRDPATILPSYVSLLVGFRSLYERDIDRREIALRQLEVWAAAAERAIEVRKRRDPAQFFDLHFQEFRADPVGSVRRIYEHFDHEMSPQAEQHLNAWGNDNPQHKHGKHDYDADIGVSRTEILDRFASYMDHYGMKAEGS